MKAHGFGLTDPGAKRNYNEDSFVSDSQLNLFIVCDGVSGNQAGEEASQTCAKTVRDYLFEHRNVVEKYKTDRTPAARAQVALLMQKALEEANSKVHKAGQADAKKKGMATTASAVLIAHDHAILGHVGDSRIYLMRQGKIHQLTLDHTVADEMRRQGIWTEAEAKKSPYATTLTRAIGMQEYVPVDLLQVELVQGDKLLLCSDGLTHYVKPVEIFDWVRKAPADTVPAELTKIAKERGGHDNITTILVNIESDMPRTEALDALKKGEVIGRVPLFRYLAYPELLKILGLVKVRTYKTGETIIREGTLGDELFVIAAGRIEILKGTQIVAVRGKGEFLGEIGFFNNIPRTASVRAKEETTMLAFSRQDLISLLRKEPAITVKFLWSISQELSYRISEATRDLADAKAGTDPERTLPDFELPFIS